MTGIPDQVPKTHPLDVALDRSIRGDLDGAEELLRSLPQDDLRVRFNLGWHECRHGNWKLGHELMDSGRFLNVYGSPPLLGGGKRIWAGEDLRGKSVLLRLEGGIGDEIIQSRWAVYFSPETTVVMSCHPSLIPVFKERLEYGYQPELYVTNDGAPHVHCDYWIPAMSGPRWFPVERFPYLKRNFEEHRGIRIGLRWSGNPQFEHHQHRSIPAGLMLSLAECFPNFEFASFQRDHDCVPLPKAVRDRRPDMVTWADTFRELANLDLLITSCTSVAHAAAAMGVRTWVIVPTLPYTVWSMGGDRTPWYTSARIFRQKAFGDWETVMAEVGDALEEFERTAVRSGAI